MWRTLLNVCKWKNLEFFQLSFASEDFVRHVTGAILAIYWNQFHIGRLTHPCAPTSAQHGNMKDYGRCHAKSIRQHRKREVYCVDWIFRASRIAHRGRHTSKEWTVCNAIGNCKRD